MMKTYRLAIALAAINLILVLFVLNQGSSATAKGIPPLIRARMIELVDDKGQVRAQLNVESSGEVVFRLRDAQGTIRVKLGASADGSGLLLANDATEPGIHMLAKDTGTTLTLTGKDGKQRVIKP
jgi:hypothetical protein